MTRLRPLAERHHAMVVGRGLYLLRYVSAPLDKDCPSIAVNQRPVNDDITLIAAPGRSATHLEMPGDCMVIRAETPGPLSLIAATDSTDGTIDAEVRLERIFATAETQPVARRAAETRRTVADRQQISILAHVSRRGDVLADAGEWICGPDMPLPIEGIEIRWPNMPDGVGLSCSVASGRGAGKHAAGAGEFAGTRGKAASLTALELALTGPASRDYELTGEALFLGAAIASQRGRKLSFAGPTGREPLVGLRLEVVQSGTKPVSKTKPATAIPTRPAGKVRIYRSIPGAAASPMLIDQNATAAPDRGI